MGRGRAKAKQTKVARRLKYSSGGTDLTRLQAELGGGTGAPGEELDGELEDELDDDEDWDDDADAAHSH